jgi:hypothetical protein
MGMGNSKDNGGPMGIAIILAVVLVALGIILLISRPRTH